MTDSLQTMLQQAGQATAAFPPNSRYYGIAVANLESAGREPMVYVRRRFVPPAERFFLLQEHTVTEGERPDNLAHQYLGDSEQFWRLCDGNGVMEPHELTDNIGATIRITLPEGIPGHEHA